MTPQIVDAIVAKFGSQQKLADAIGRRQSTVAHWKARKNIPSREIPKILAAARERAIDLTYADFFEERSAA